MSEKKVIENPEEFHIQPCDIGSASFGVYNEAFNGDRMRGTGAWAIMRFHKGKDSWHAFRDSEFGDWSEWTIGIIEAFEALVDDGYLVRQGGPDGICQVTEELIELCFKASNRSDS